MADMIDLEDEKRIFEVRAYRKVALNLESMQEDVSEILNKKGILGLMELQGVGKGLAEKIKEFLETGKIKKYEELKKKYPIDFSNLTRIQGMGSKRAFILYKELGVRTVDDLSKAINSHKISQLKGFGKRSESELEKGLLLLESSKGRITLGAALPEAEAIIKRLINSGFVEKAELAGSTRRMKETVGDLDILVISNKPDLVMEFAGHLPEVESVIVKGPTKTTVMLKIGISCDIRVVKKESFGAAMQYFIGSKDHNVKVRQLAIKKGYKLNEYGLFDLKERIVANDDEKEIYKLLGMSYPEPEMRENRGEIELALHNKLPKLLSLKDIKGDLHVHSKNSDGTNTIKEMTDAALALGYEYIGMTDHSKNEYVANGMTEQRFMKYIQEIDSVNDQFNGKIHVLKSAETDILKDGTLDFSTAILDEMDYVLASIHTNLNMDKEAMTKRVITAMESGKIDILAHPTDRIIHQRDPINLDLDKVFQSAKDNGVIMEIDGYPDRLDLNDENIFKAREYGIKFSVDSDAHRMQHLTLLRFGIGMAKRGWLESSDVVNTLSLKQLLKLFHA